MRLALAGALRAKSASEAQLLLGGAGVADGHDLVDSRAAASAAAAATAAAAAAAAAADDDDDDDDDDDGDDDDDDDTFPAYPADIAE